MLDRKLFGGLVRMHILHHACHEPIFGVGIMEELARHGYTLSPGTLYPILHGMLKQGYLVASQEHAGGRMRKHYTATAEGRAALVLAKSRVRELFLRTHGGKPIGLEFEGKEKVSGNSADCVLCTPQDVVLENELAFVCHDDNSLSPGHVLVIPRRHVASFST